MPIKTKVANLAITALSVIAVTVYFVTWSKLSLNIPIGDDFPAFVDLTTKYVSGNFEFSDFFTQINEHRIFYNRAWWLSILSLSDVVNFKLLLFIGNLSLVFLLLFYIKVIHQLSITAWLIPVVTFLIFTWVGYSNSLCSMMALQNYTFPFLVCIGLWLIAQSSSLKLLVPGILLLLLAFYTTGIGFIAIVFGLGSLLYRKQYRLALIFSIVNGLFISLYFFFYLPSPVQSDIFIGLSNPLELLIRYFAFLGGILNISVLSPYPEAFLGLILASAFVYSAIRLKNSAPHFLVTITLFFLLLAAVVVLARFELNEFIANRFKINSAIIFINIALLFWKALPANTLRKLFVVAIFSLTAALNIFNYKSFNDYRFWVDEFAVDLLNVQYGIETTAYQPKGQAYIRSEFYHPDFQKSYRGLNSTNITNSAIPVNLVESEPRNFKVKFTPNQLDVVRRPILCCKDHSMQIIGYIPLHLSNRQGEEWSFKDASNVISSTKVVHVYIADLEP